MSLNGLDDPKVKEAHDTAVAEPGGWFLLKYASREEVELLGRGNGGIVEIRNAIANFEEVAPLFGFLRYRRRNVLIKYVPEEASRLIQARATVHFNAVTERFSPHDTVFPIATAKELRDSTLSAACSLHTASGSTSSSTSSLRRRRLMEIAEDAEEDIRSTKRQSTVPEERPGTAKAPSITGPSGPPPNHTLPPLSLSTDSPIESRDFEVQPRSPTKAGDEPRKSSQSTRPEIYSHSSYTYTGKPKIKLGPRPSLDSGGRPHTSGATSHYRPVSTLPAGLKLFSKGSKTGKDRPKSQFITEPPSMTISPPGPETMPQPLQAPRPHTSGGPRPTSSSGASIKPIMPIHSIAPKTPSMTPEKARLMKALEMRKKKLNASPASPSPAEPQSATASDELNVQSIETRRISMGAPQEVQDTLGMLDDMAREDDSAISFHTTSTLKTDESDAARSDSYPVSPAGPSERAESTRASSISESTDETIQLAEPLEAEPRKEGESLNDTTMETEPKKEVEDSKNIMLEAEPKKDVEILNDSTMKTEPMKEVEDSENTMLKAEPKKDVENVKDTMVEAEPKKVPIKQLQPLHRHERRSIIPITTHDLPSLEELPNLLPVTYQPTPSPITVPSIMKSNTEPEKVSPVSDVADSPVDETSQLPVPEMTSAPTTVEHNANEEKEETKTDASIEPNKRTSRASFSSASIPTSSFNKNRAVPSEEALENKENGNATAKRHFRAGSIPTSSFNQAARDAALAQAPTLLSASPTDADKKEVKIPTSKFSKQESKADADVPLASIETPQLTLVPPPISPIDSTHSADVADDDNGNSLPVKKTKRRGFVEPLKINDDFNDRSGANSEANISSDDDLMDELQDAVFHEAKPISVSKSPISPVFSNDVPSPKKKEGNRFSRAFSSPMRKDTSDSSLLSPHIKPNSARSVSSSAAFLNRVSQQPEQPLVKKTSVGSSISQRIKALERLSSAAPGVTSTGPAPSTAFFSVRSGSRDSKSPSIAERANSLNRNSPSPILSREPSPETNRSRERSGSIKSRLNAFNGNSTARTPSLSRPESISVTARIVRDPSQPFPTQPEAGKDPQEYSPLDLKESLLEINHRKAVVTPPKETILERRLSTSSKASRASKASRSSKIGGKERRSSVTVVKDLISQGRASLSERRKSVTIDQPIVTPSLLSPSRPPSAHTNGSPGINKAMSISSRRSTSSRDTTISPTPSGSSASEEKDKKTSRTSRMMKRMSSSISSSRKNIAHAMSPTVREESEPLASPAPPTQPALAAAPTASFVEIGDVNVQFPDTLLWKRRSMVLDSQGYLIVSPAQGNDRDKANAIRRYHLSAFRSPSVPDLEMEELPNSVVLDFVEGGGLQVACEDRGGQGRVLKILQEAHRTWAAYGQ